MELTDTELEDLDAANLERLAALQREGVSVAGNHAGTERYVILLLEAVVGPQVRRRCQEEAAVWLRDSLDTAEEQVAQFRRQMKILQPGLNGGGGRPSSP